MAAGAVWPGRLVHKTAETKETQDAALVFKDHHSTHMPVPQSWPPSLPAGPGDRPWSVACWFSLGEQEKNEQVTSLQKP